VAVTTERGRILDDDALTAGNEKEDADGDVNTGDFFSVMNNTDLIEDAFILYFNRVNKRKRRVLQRFRFFQQ